MSKKTAFIATTKLYQKTGFTMGNNGINVGSVADVFQETEETMSKKYGKNIRKVSRRIGSLR